MPRVPIHLPHIHFIAANTIQWGDITGLIENQQDLVDFVKNTVGNNISNELANVQNEINNINVDISTINGDIININNDINNLDNRISVNEQDIVDIKVDVATINSALTTINNELITINSTLTSLDGRVTNLESTVSTINSSITTIEGAILTLNTTITSMQTDISNIQTKLNTIETGAEVNVQSDWNELNTTSDAFILNKPDFTGLSNDVTTIQGNINNLQTDVSNIQTDVTNIQTNITNIQTDVSNIQNDITTIQGNITNIQSNITSLGNRVTNIESDVSVLKLFSQNVNEWAKNPTVITTTQDLNKLINNGIYCTTGSNANNPGSYGGILIVCQSGIYVYQLHWTYQWLSVRNSANNGNTWQSWSTIPSSTTVNSLLANKVDKVAGMGLSTNDYTTPEKTKLAGIAAGAEVNVQSDWNETNPLSDAYILNKPNNLASNWGTITGTLSNQTDLWTELTNINTAIQNLIVGGNLIGNSVVTNISEDNLFTNTTRLVQSITNPSDGTTSTSNIDLALASSTNSGIMPSSAFNAIATNTQNIGLLQQIGVRYPTSYALTPSLTQPQVLSIYQSVVNNASAVPNDGDSLLSFEPTTLLAGYVWFASTNTWEYKSIASILPATNSTLGIVKGDATTDGNISVNLDATMTLNGYSTLATHIQTHDTQIQNLQFVTGQIFKEILFTPGVPYVWNGLIENGEFLSFGMNPSGYFNTNQSIIVQDDNITREGRLSLMYGTTIDTLDYIGQTVNAEYKQLIFNTDTRYNVYFVPLYLQSTDNWYGYWVICMAMLPFMTSNITDASPGQGDNLIQSKAVYQFQQSITAWARNSGLSYQNIDANDIWQNGVYSLYSYTPNIPTNSEGNYVLVHYNSGTRYTQVAYNTDDNRVFIRNAEQDNNTGLYNWNPWIPLGGSSVDLTGILNDITNLQTDVSTLQTDVVDLDDNKLNIDDQVKVINLTSPTVTVNFEIIPYVDYLFNLSTELYINTVISITDTVNIKSSVIQVMNNTGQMTNVGYFGPGTKFKAFWNGTYWQESTPRKQLLSDDININNGNIAASTGLTYTLKSYVDNYFVQKVAGMGLSTNDYTTPEKTKLAGIAAGAQVNVQSDWNVTNSTSDAFILNKPNITGIQTDITNLNTRVTTNEGNISTLQTDVSNKVDKVAGMGLSTNDFTNTLLTKLNGIQAGAQVNVQSDWNEAVSTSNAFILNKPDVASLATRITTAEGNITGLTTRMTTAENNITSIQTSLNGGTALASGLYNITTNSQGRVTAGSAVTSANIASLGVAITDTVTGVSTTGSGNAITAITASGGQITATSGLTFVTNDRIQLVASLPGSPVANVLYLIPE